MVEASLALAPDERDALIARVKLISWLSLAWMTTEGVIGTTAGIMANSIALIGYGIDSTITGVASMIIIWRFSGDRIDSDDAEARALRIVAITFFLLAPYIIVTAIHHLVTGSEAQASWVGIGLAIVSVTLMPLFGRAKKRIGDRLGPTQLRERGLRTFCARISRTRSSSDSPPTPSSASGGRIRSWRSSWPAVALQRARVRGGDDTSGPARQIPVGIGSRSYATTWPVA